MARNDVANARRRVQSRRRGPCIDEHNPPDGGLQPAADGRNDARLRHPQVCLHSLGVQGTSYHALVVSLAPRVCVHAKCGHWSPSLRLCLIPDWLCIGVSWQCHLPAATCSIWRHRSGAATLFRAAHQLRAVSHQWRSSRQWRPSCLVEPSRKRAAGPHREGAAQTAERHTWRIAQHRHDCCGQLYLQGTAQRISSCTTPCRGCTPGHVACRGQAASAWHLWDRRHGRRAAAGH